MDFEQNVKDAPRTHRCSNFTRSCQGVRALRKTGGVVMVTDLRPAVDSNVGISGEFSKIQDLTLSGRVTGEVLCQVVGRF